MQTHLDQIGDLDLAGYLATLQRRWWLLVLVGALAGAGAYLATSMRGPSYSGSATIFVRADSESGGDLASGVSAAIQLARTYSGVVTSPEVIERVAAAEYQRGTAPRFTDRIKARQQPDTPLIVISATASDAFLAAELTNQTAEAFIAWVSDQHLPGQVTIISRAVPPIDASGLPPIAYAASALLLALAVTATGLVLHERSDQRVWSPRDVQRNVDLPVLASLPAPRGDLIVGAAITPDSPVSEATHSLRTRLQFATKPRGLGAITVTSAQVDEGQAIVAANLAVTLAQAGYRVILVDGHIRRPRHDQLFGLPRLPGLSNWLADPGYRLQRLVIDPAASHARHAVPMSGLHVLPAGTSNDSAGRLTSERVESLIAALKTMADVIVLDAPPVLTASASILFAGASDDAVLVVGAGRTRPDVLGAAVATLKSTGVHIPGIILVGLERERRAS
jgi:succinoglycan biosynthesis transport protein ExoP